MPLVHSAGKRDCPRATRGTRTSPLISWTRSDTLRTPVRNQLLIANADGSGEQALSNLESPHGISPEGAAWSADGRSIAFGHISFFDRKMQLMEADAATGKMSLLSPREWRYIGRVAWVADGSALGLSGADLDFRSRKRQCAAASLWTGDHQSKSLTTAQTKYTGSPGPTTASAWRWREGTRSATPFCSAALPEL